jgi:hypothetical protein
MSQSPKPRRHVAVQVPPLHVVPGHGVLHPPQCAVLRVTSTQRPLQHSSPGLQRQLPSLVPLSCSRTMLSVGSSTSLSTIVPLSVASIAAASRGVASVCESALALSRAASSKRGSYTAQPLSSKSAAK